MPPDERTLPPTPSKIREARSRGMVASSAELTASAALLAAAAALGAAGPGLAEGLVDLVAGATGGGDRLDPLAIDPGAFVNRVRGAARAVAAPMLAVLAAPALAAILAHQLQVGGLFVPSLVVPDPGRIRPGSRGVGLADRLARALGALLRWGIVALLAWWSVRSALAAFDHLPPDSTPARWLAEASAAIRGALFRLGLALLAIGLVDLAWQAWRLHARLRMTPEELREERREQGGAALRPNRRTAGVGATSEAEGVGAISPRAGSVG